MEPRPKHPGGNTVLHDLRRHRYLRRKLDTDRKPITTTQDEAVTAERAGLDALRGALLHPLANEHERAKRCDGYPAHQAPIAPSLPVHHESFPIGSQSESVFEICWTLRPDQLQRPSM